MVPAAPPFIFSPHRRAGRCARLANLQRLPDAPRFVAEAMADEIIDRAGFMNLEPATASVLGDWTGSIAQDLAQRGASVSAIAPAEVDEERPLTGGPYDFISSTGLLDTVNDLPGALVHLRSALADGGILMAILPGAGSLLPLRKALLAAEPDRPAARMHPMVDAQAASGLMQRAGFARQVVDAQVLRVRYGSLDRLISDLRAQGLGNVLASPAPPLTRTSLQRAREAFLEQRDEDGKVTVAFELLTLTGWK